ncbi:hypothetical protein AB0J81_22095 [Streptomyces bobili]|uniref:hypothetical protein n=1 Tax=Streptomyces bobili TaxID=67280 RepID=UPI003418C98C
MLKLLTRRKTAECRWAASDDPRNRIHRRREAHVYESGLAQAWQPYGIRAPRLLACVERLPGWAAKARRLAPQARFPQASSGR